jgi:hypothetical protein
MQMLFASNVGPVEDSTHGRNRTRWIKQMEFQCCVDRAVVAARPVVVQAGLRVGVARV